MPMQKVKRLQGGGTAVAQLVYYNGVNVEECLLRIGMCEVEAVCYIWV